MSKVEEFQKLNMEKEQLKKMILKLENKLETVYVKIDNLMEVENNVVTTV
jgi:hypothetical protein